MMTEKKIRELAAIIAEDLFINGSGQLAQRLVLTVDTPTKRDLGGWSQAAMADRIGDILVADGFPSPAHAKEHAE